MRGSSLILLVLPALLACGGGGDNGTGDAGHNTTEQADPAWFGLADKKCLYFKDGNGNPRYTVEMRRDDVSVPGVKTFHLVYKSMGWEKRSDWLEVSGKDLRLHRRQDRDQDPLNPTSPLFRYAPAPTLARKDLAEGDVIETATTVTISRGANTETRAETWRANTMAADPVDIGGASVQPLRVLLTSVAGADQTTDDVDFAPQHGFVRYRLWAPWGNDPRAVLDRTGTMETSAAGQEICPQ